MENTTEDLASKCFCVKCSNLIDPSNKVNIQGENFHINCLMCCMCKVISSTLLFSGHPFCKACFDCISNHFSRSPIIQTDGWWLHCGPHSSCPDFNNANTKYSQGMEEKESNKETSQESLVQCLRCLQNIDKNSKIVIDGKPFHKQCARCCVCHIVPKSLEIYYGSIFCNDCFRLHILNRNGTNLPSDFFKSCFEEWHRNPLFAEQMKQFMSASSSTNNKATVFVMNDSNNISQNASSKPKCE